MEHFPTAKQWKWEVIFKEKYEKLLATPSDSFQLKKQKQKKELNNQLWDSKMVNNLHAMSLMAETFKN